MLARVLQVSLGVLLCTLIGVAAVLLSDYLPLGSVALAILLGILIGNTVPLGGRFDQGIAFSERHVLAWAIALMGVNLNYGILQELGFRSLALIISALGFTLLLSVVLGKVFRWDPKLTLLVGIGNGVCGTSAIAATETIIGAHKEDVGVAVAVVNGLGTVGMLMLPILATWVLHLGAVDAGLLIGNTLQAVGQVTAGGFSVSEVTGQTATIVKMARILLLTPLVFVLIYLYAPGKREGAALRPNSAFRGIPLFILGFVLFSLISTLKLLPEVYLGVLAKVSHWALVLAMAGIGLRITLASLMRSGKSALLLGGMVFLGQILFTTVVILAFF